MVNSPCSSFNRPSFSSRTHIPWFTTAYDSSSKSSTTFFWLQQAQAYMWFIWIYSILQIHVQNNKINTLKIIYRKWMELDITISIEIIQTQKNKCHLFLSHAETWLVSIQESKVFKQMNYWSWWSRW